jgi:signal transduction histidine kinase
MTRRCFKEHLIESNRARDPFLAAMSHELRIPMTAIAGAVRILKSHRMPESRRETIVELLDRNVTTLKLLLDNMLDCSRIASGKMSLEFEPVNLNECVAAALGIMRTKATEARVELRALFPPKALMVQGNALRLQQIAWNLIDNAIKFTPPGGSISISILHDAADVELLVCDSGVGLSEQDKEKIFEPFTQAAESDAQKGGLGLGLALVRNLTQMHNGTVRAESTGLGQGCRFIVKLPLLASG